MPSLLKARGVTDEFLDRLHTGRSTHANALYGSIQPEGRPIPDHAEVRRIFNEERYAKIGANP